MQAGQLTEIIEIYAPTISTNEYGEQIQIFERVYVTRAQVVKKSGNRGIENDEVFYNYNKTFKIRRYVRLNENYQIKYYNKRYRILSIDDDRMRNEKTIETELINE